MSKFQTPRGTNDILPSESVKWQQIEQIIREMCTLYNYDEIRTPIFEDTGVFKRENDSSDMVNKEMYTFSINGKDSLTLRPEMTAGVVRSFVQHKMYGEPDLPKKMFYIGPQFRYERPQKGRQRIFHQFGVEAIGAKDPMLDVEVITLGYTLVKIMGMNDLCVMINTLGDDESRNNYRNALREYFKPYLDQMCDDCKRRFEQNPLRILDCKVDKDQPFMKDVPRIQDYLNDESKAYFEMVCEGLDALEIPYKIDDRLVRGLDYYAHTVFEVVSLNENMGSQSTVFAGGRYDGLVKYFGGPEMSGIGFAMGLERLIIALEGEGVKLGEEKSIDAYVLVLSDNVKIPAQEIVTELRHNGYSAEIDYNSRKFKAQFKTVERLNAKFAVLVGDKDIENNQVTIKRISDQKQFVVSLDEVVACFDANYENDEEHHHH